MDETTTPRVNGSMLPKFIGRDVCVVARNVGGGGTAFQMETSDKQRISVNFQYALSEPLSIYVELIGKVENDLSLSVGKWINFGADFDLDAYDQLIQLTPKFLEVFPS